MLIAHATLITWGTNNQVLEDHALYIEKGRIADLGRQTIWIKVSPCRAPGCQRAVCDARQYLCAYALLRSFSAGHGDPWRTTGGEFSREILAKAMVATGSFIDTPSMCALQREVMLVDAIRHGTATLNDHHALPECDRLVHWISSPKRLTDLVCGPCCATKSLTGMARQRPTPGLMKTCALSNVAGRKKWPGGEWRPPLECTPALPFRNLHWKPAVGLSRRMPVFTCT